METQRKELQKLLFNNEQLQRLITKSMPKLNLVSRNR